MSQDTRSYASNQLPFGDKVKEFIDDQIAVLTKPVDWNGKILAGSTMSKETVKAIYEHVNLERDVVISTHFNQIAKMSVVEQLTEIQRVKEIDEKERREEEDNVIFIDKGKSSLLAEFPQRWPGDEHHRDSQVKRYDQKMSVYKSNLKLINDQKNKIAEYKRLYEMLSKLSDESIELNCDVMEQDTFEEINDRLDDMPNQDIKSIYTANHLDLFLVYSKPSLLVLHGSDLDSYTQLSDELENSFDTAYKDIQRISQYDLDYNNLLLLSDTLPTNLHYPILDNLQHNNIVITSESNNLSNLARQFNLQLSNKPITAFDGANELEIHSNPHSCTLSYNGHSHSYISNSQLIHPSLSSPPATSHSKSHLISSLQSTKNTRMSWISSKSFLNDTSLSNECNKQSALDVLLWTFQQKGVVKVTQMKHYKTGESETPEYVYNDESNFELHLSDENNQPFTTHSLQLDFTMLDPHIRAHVPPSHISEDGTSMVYKLTFRVPDRHGIFKFVVDWKRQGYSFIDEQMRTTVAPIRHDEHPRFLNHAWPFYSGTLFTLVSFVAFAALWLSWDDKIKGKKSE
ncbi:hypothetical protein E3P92_04087 [Wallemia ichthyophaga]|nr:hypothetical protein E3P91_04108 [Wallemia ichthyophaga]TIA77826.1 hypothetical protein E3P98_04072 [Wallemia ichthyophaga]TIA87047.1 hypothetical protein E3P97_04084 [Wallemia ichthyophaga]TIA94756.1 hypothetical protein E3P95_04085 [Wallemia ichthyophaga]TIA95336.1 hypothetical protein E3P94_04085 [Wallemia ichthyophaga]